MKRQQQPLSRVLLLVLLGIYCLCATTTAIPISEEEDDHYGGSGLSIFLAKGEDALRIAPRGGGGGREEQRRDLYSAMVVGKGENYWGGLDGNGNKEGVLALNNNSPVVGGDGSGTLGGKGGDGQTPEELASLSPSSSSGGRDSSVSSTSSGNTLVKQQESTDIDPSAQYVHFPFSFNPSLLFFSFSSSASSSLGPKWSTSSSMFPTWPTPSPLPQKKPKNHFSRHTHTAGKDSPPTLLAIPKPR